MIAGGGADRRKSGFDVSEYRWRFLGAAATSSCSEDAFRFRSDRDPSSGSSSRMSVLKTEWEPGLDAPRWAGSRSRVNLVADDRRRETASSGFSGSRAWFTQFRHLHLLLSRRC